MTLTVRVPSGRAATAAARLFGVVGLFLLLLLTSGLPPTFFVNAAAGTSVLGTLLVTLLVSASRSAWLSTGARVAPLVGLIVGGVWLLATGVHMDDNYTVIGQVARSVTAVVAGGMLGLLLTAVEAATRHTAADKG